MYFLLTTLLLVTQVLARDDGLARTPPMGWLSWDRFQCQIDCKKYPHSCINEELYKEHADRLVKDGFKELGYDFVSMDDCWMEMERDSQHKLVADKKRFPSGIKALADYMHSKGLKLGIYGDIGTKTCKGYPGLNGANATSNYFKIDSKTLAEWGVDSFKCDQCHEDHHLSDKLFPEMAQAFNESGRKILLNCEWANGQINWKIKPNYEEIAKTCHIFRAYNDVYDSWGNSGIPGGTSGIHGIIDFFAKNNDDFMKHNGPGHFFDPDMLIIGNMKISYEQAKTQMSMWSMWSSPLLMSNDLRNLDPKMKTILQNKEVIAVDQDKHGQMAKLIHNKEQQQVWVKNVEPIKDGVWSHVVLYLETRDSGNKSNMSEKLSDLIPNLKANTEYIVHDLFKEEGKEIIGTLKSTESLTLLVNNGGGSRMVKLIPK